MKWKGFLALFTGRDKFKTHLLRHSEATDCGEQSKSEDKLGEHGKRMHNVLNKAAVARDKEGEVFGPESADLERGGKKLEPAVERSYNRNKIYVETCPHCQKSFTEHHNIRKHIGPIH